MISQRHLRHESRRGLPPCIARRNQQALKHLGLAHCAARRQQQRGPEEFDDLLQESRVGLIRGLERFDRQRGVQPSSYLLSRATGQVLHYRRDRSRTIRIPWRLRDLYAAGVKIQREREQNRLPSLSDQELATELSVRPERWAAAVQSHGASQVVDLFSSPGEPASSCAEDEHLDWLRSVLHQVEGKAGMVLQAHLIEGQSLRDLAQGLNCSRSSLRLHLNEGLGLLRQWAHRDGLMPIHTS
ncbi:sigma-70 family RNA polymerase sigma factor [Synechococcus sp. YX-04-1]|uniref:sigma-70 family RNA polymerase sigma factor n=1 Tax=Synechococcus sp. YX-04-1 TaxID=3062778 RepID=UPI0026E45C25|nr:sigma-70 family RNA polymerase sigma factor [Synechococcus sp. YX-04-1]MDO6351703.1 sigma-70 family RNA polymerase sigma factor [Synechococcus sp. YX-04-1]